MNSQDIHIYHFEWSLSKVSKYNETVENDHNDVILYTIFSFCLFFRLVFSVIYNYLDKRCL